MNEAKVVLPPLTGLDLQLLWWVLGSAFLALSYGVYLAFKVRTADPGSQKMREVARAIREGAEAYLRRQFSVMIWFVAALTVILFFLYWKAYGEDAAGVRLAWGVAGAFLAGR